MYGDWNEKHYSVFAAAAYQDAMRDSGAYDEFEDDFQEESDPSYNMPPFAAEEYRRSQLDNFKAEQELLAPRDGRDYNDPMLVEARAMDAQAREETVQDTRLTDEKGNCFNGFYTIESPDGKHLTFRVRTKQQTEEEKKAGKFVRFLGLLIGPQNTNDYKDFAIVSDRGDGKVWTFKKLRGQNGQRSKHEINAARFEDILKGDKSQLLKQGYLLHLSKRCLICNRELTTPESVRTGIGPICGGRE